MTENTPKKPSSRLEALPCELQDSAIRRAIILAKRENQEIELALPDQGSLRKIMVSARDSFNTVFERLKDMRKKE